MAQDRGVTCKACGGSTPLPDDLTVATFPCQFCRAVLETHAHAGEQAVTADQLASHLRGLAANAEQAVRGEHDRGAAPAFADHNAATRAGSCTACGAPVAVPLDLRVHQFSCAACGRAHRVADYVSDQERFELDQARQVAGNEALRALRETGVACTKCGGKNDVPADGSVQLGCRFCGATILLSDHVDAGAVARARLKEAAFEIRDDLMFKEAQIGRASCRERVS
jgi:hypothetical protein